MTQAEAALLAGDTGEDGSAAPASADGGGPLGGGAETLTGMAHAMCGSPQQQASAASAAATATRRRRDGPSPHLAAQPATLSAPLSPGTGIALPSSACPRRRWPRRSSPRRSATPPTPPTPPAGRLARGAMPHGTTPSSPRPAPPPPYHGLGTLRSAARCSRAAARGAGGRGTGGGGGTAVPPTMPPHPAPDHAAHLVTAFAPLMHGDSSQGGGGGPSGGLNAAHPLLQVLIARLCA